MATETKTQEEAGLLFEVPEIKPLLYVSTLVTFAIYLCTFWFFYSSGIHLIWFMPLFSSYIYTYILILFLVFALFAAHFFLKGYGHKKFSEYKLLGLLPIEFVNRTGVRFVDIVGLIVSGVFALESIFVPGYGILTPGFILLALSFFTAIITGSAKKWKLERRKKE